MLDAAGGSNVNWTPPIKPTGKGNDKKDKGSGGQSIPITPIPNAPQSGGGTGGIVPYSGGSSSTSNNSSIGNSGQREYIKGPKAPNSGSGGAGANPDSGSTNCSNSTNANNSFKQGDFGLSFDAASIQDQLNKGNEVIVDGASMESNGFKNIRIAKDNTVMFQLNDQALKDYNYQKKLVKQFTNKESSGLEDYKYNYIVKKDRNGKSKKVITEIGHKHIHASSVKKDENNNFHLSYSI